MKNALNWFGIPAADFNSAKAFNEAVLGAEMPVNE